MHRTRRVARLPIRDPIALARLLQDVLEQSHNGSQAHAARAIGGPKKSASEAAWQTLLSRLLGCSQRSIQAKTYRRLRELVPNDRHDELFDAVASPEAWALLEAYDRWIVERGDRFVLRRGMRYRLTPAGLRRERGSHFMQRDAELSHLLRHLREDVALRSYRRSFEDRATALGHSRMRIALAVVRTLEPLLERSESGFIERGWKELSPDELRQFIEAGFARESILLRRPPRIQRAQAMLESAKRGANSTKNARRSDSSGGRIGVRGPGL